MDLQEIECNWCGQSVEVEDLQGGLCSECNKMLSDHAFEHDERVEF